MEQVAGEGAALADVETYDYEGETRRRRLGFVVAAFVALVIIGLVVWQFASLHHQVNHLRQTEQAQEARSQQLQHDLSQMHSNLNAAVGCLQSPQAQQGLCSKLIR